MSKNYITTRSKFTSELQGAINRSFPVTNFDVEACNRRSRTEPTFKINVSCTVHHDILLFSTNLLHNFSLYSFTCCYIRLHINLYMFQASLRSLSGGIKICKTTVSSQHLASSLCRGGGQMLRGYSCFTNFKSS
jgi:hypothetical protein